MLDLSYHLSYHNLASSPNSTHSVAFMMTPDERGLRKSMMRCTSKRKLLQGLLKTQVEQDDHASFEEFRALFVRSESNCSIKDLSSIGQPENSPTHDVSSKKFNLKRGNSHRDLFPEDDEKPPVRGELPRSDSIRSIEERNRSLTMKREHTKRNLLLQVKPQQEFRAIYSRSDSTRSLIS